jgi:hypothetical protein
MFVTRRRVVCLIIGFSLMALTSCSAKMSSANKTADSTAAAGTAVPTTSQTVTLKQNIDMSAEAATLKTTPGKVALALIICKMDNSRALEDLAQKDSQDLLSILSEIAQQKSRTLESLNEQYDLVDILASENIFISIKSNAVTSAPAKSSSDLSWIPKFQDAINQS